jgi:hypothetical protein
VPWQLLDAAAAELVDLGRDRDDRAYRNDDGNDDAIASLRTKFDCALDCA